LHAKTFSVDGERVFVGSFNFDPRSANLNTELGFLIHSPPLAARIENLFDTVVPVNAYSVHLDEDDDLYWLERNDGETLRHEKEPRTSVWRRGWVRFVSWLPVEWLL
jgi:putative cardiolipin synthase